MTTTLPTLPETDRRWQGGTRSRAHSALPAWLRSGSKSDGGNRFGSGLHSTATENTITKSHAKKIQLRWFDEETMS
jgi:hypothetical protein